MKTPYSGAITAAVATLDPAVRMMLAEDLPQQMAAIKAAILKGGWGTAAGIVHSVHGSAAFCRLDALRESAARLEGNLKSQEANADLVSTFENEVSRVLHALGHDQHSE